MYFWNSILQCGQNKLLGYLKLCIFLIWVANILNLSKPSIPQTGHKSPN
jgi:hypothetical protein